MDLIEHVVGSSGLESDSANGEASSVSRLELFPSVASFAEAPPPGHCSGPSVSLSFDLGPVETVPWSSMTTFVDSITVFECLLNTL